MSRKTVLVAGLAVAVVLIVLPYIFRWRGDYELALVREAIAASGGTTTAEELLFGFEIDRELQEDYWAWTGSGVGLFLDYEVIDKWILNGRAGEPTSWYDKAETGLATWSDVETAMAPGLIAIRNPKLIGSARGWAQMDLSR
ncbi:MAG: hypothetical protein AAF517_26095, partial [Planctomycetota bacterium]